MARPKTIPWEKRVALFLAYRQNGGKVTPVVNRYLTPRSTVSLIVKEFREMGFALRPRANVSTEFLQQMQEEHFQDVLHAAGGPSNGKRLTTKAVGNLNLTAATDEQGAWKMVEADDLPIPEELHWHLKGTAAERVILEARNAARDFHQRDYLAWRDLRLALEAACGLPELPEMDSPPPQDRRPHLLPVLKTRLRDRLLVSDLQRQAPGLDWLEWDVASGYPRVLRLKGEHVAEGSPEDHQRVKDGVAGFLTHSYQDLQRRFVEVKRLRRDLELLQRVLAITLAFVSEEEIRRRICPACPYPEAQQEPALNPQDPDAGG